MKIEFDSKSWECDPGCLWVFVWVLGLAALVASIGVLLRAWNWAFGGGA